MPFHQRSRKTAPLLKTPTVEVLFEDDDIVVINKPAGLLSLPDRFNVQLPNLRTILTEQYGEIFIVHRIDRDTSGAMLFAKNAESHKHLSEQFETRAVKKVYHAVTQGIVQEDEMTIDIPLAPDPARKGLMMPSVRGKESLTITHVLKRFRLATLLECELFTGRQHQIRVHCAAIGHPLLVDADYGNAGEFSLSTIKRRYNTGKYHEERPIIARTTLHSTKLGLQHPRTGEDLTFEAPYPKDFKALLQVLEKYSPGKTSFGASLWQTPQDSIQERRGIAAFDEFMQDENDISDED